MTIHCDNCDKEIDPGTARPVHTDTQYEYCARTFNDPGKATVPARKKYTVIMNDGIGPGSGEPEKPRNGNQADSIEEAVRMFRSWMRDSGNDYLRAAGYDQPGAEIILTENWDGISYGDWPWTCLLVRGVRGGVKVESV